MRAVEIRGGFGLDNLALVERPDPRPGPGQVLVRVRAASLNYRDLLTVEGKYNPKQKLPLIPCSDGAGEVVAVGEGVTRVQAGRPRLRHLRADAGSPGAPDPREAALDPRRPARRHARRAGRRSPRKAWCALRRT